jgi:hypothetical protein
MQRSAEPAAGKAIEAGALQTGLGLVKVNTEGLRDRRTVAELQQVRAGLL